MNIYYFTHYIFMTLFWVENMIYDAACVILKEEQIIIESVFAGRKGTENL